MSMGAVECLKHGLQINSGPLCCEHVSSAVHSNQSSVNCESLQIDFIDDGSLIYDAVICKSCIENYNINTKEMLSGDRFEKQSEQEEFPWVAPACPECFANYRFVEHSLGLIKKDTGKQ